MQPRVATAEAKKANLCLYASQKVAMCCVCNCSISFGTDALAVAPSAQPVTQESAHRGTWQEVKPSSSSSETAQLTAPTAASGWTEVKPEAAQLNAPLVSGALVSAALSQRPFFD